MQILWGKELAAAELEKLKKEIEDLKLPRSIRLAIVQVGDNPASNKYIAQKIKKAEYLGVEVKLYKYKESITQDQLLKKMDNINDYSDGVIVQLPLPKHIPSQVIMDAIPYEKDIDGLSNRNEFTLYNSSKTDDKFFVPATARAVLELMDHYKIDVKDKRVAVIGRSYLVGKPVAHIIKRKGANVATYDENTGIKGVENADILIVAAGEAKLVRSKNVKEGAIVIDVGTNLDENLPDVISGDVDFEDVKDKVAAITPVPGGVGPMTVACLLKNLVDAIK
ncbi:bifunctional 5,10-methylene-tetrahydrofolate dehydrogenase/5,10-methylene-tetrahydrofolate cyclohydrolase [Mycoplasmopsis pullorum]|uniref:bifunctional 5,10-methylenetetrahydrofolate dehydrogenase/5,10-methenyltetrahydrofolate cyclohydrolase n=1 Tax=Mycoplasmopsis pullorum TaxID=48003 RepID=UPI00111A9B59|nr:bifunctional 5,10-methylenetetrahydrofolate dehydrogenase/5,10-methenyltetrahydrofolate cyclohydrolase [Mycoplasmopsis pullorum]TNK82216.1 bifunctional 5,10-methylene-tetrahydrofolate dehydrogenase/5,10-methylene-tetrahydrofolate cyclohydrolase [Mycoplasmopsis pullorum]TNK83130.1 bifunctional 5,10-methylene-tetrahydrofolate dehydrogenase/5,10-methylene-tetrahydrofolate cyclohydrolase [Mycoplasmopsis pullorum]TNK84747.1 bifunctional 5,10-methylene-tetrahydrofolate dehydrogenase/5,10-methylene-